MEIIRTEKNNDILFNTSVIENIEELFTLLIRPKKDMSAEIKKAQEQTKEINDIVDRVDLMVEKVIRSDKRISVSSHFEEKHTKLINDLLKDYSSVINYKAMRSTSIKGGVDYIVWTKD